MGGIKGLSKQENRFYAKLRKMIILTGKLKGVGLLLKSKKTECVQKLTVETMKGVLAEGLDVDKGRTANGAANAFCRTGELRLKEHQQTNEDERRKKANKRIAQCN